MTVSLWDEAPPVAALSPSDQIEPVKPDDSRAVRDAYEDCDATAGCCDMKGMT